MSRKICLVDADAFFVAVASRIDPTRAASHPDILVGGSGARSVVSSASQSARARGVRAGMPMQQARRLCPDAWVTGVPGKELRAAHSQILDCLEKWAPIVEAASVDEWYADFGGTEALYRGASLAEIATQMRNDVLTHAGYSVSIGGASSRFVAKVASDAAKPGHGGTGVYVVLDGMEPQFLAPRAITDFPGVGHVLAKRLQSLSLSKVSQIQELDQATMEAWLGSTTGKWLWDRAWGRDDSEVEQTASTRSHSRETTFETDVSDNQELAKSLGRLIISAAEAMRKENLACRTIEVKLRTSRFETFRMAKTIPDAVIADRPLYRAAKEVWTRLRGAHPGPIRLVGIRFTGLVPASERPLALFEIPEGSAETPKDALLASVGDSLRHRFGPNALRPAWSVFED